MSVILYSTLSENIAVKAWLLNLVMLEPGWSCTGGINGTIAGASRPMEIDNRVQLALDYYRSSAREAYSAQRITNKGVNFASRLEASVKNMDKDTCKEACKVLMSD